MSESAVVDHGCSRPQLQSPRWFLTLLRLASDCAYQGEGPLDGHAVCGSSKTHNCSSGQNMLAVS